MRYFTLSQDDNITDMPHPADFHDKLDIRNLTPQKAAALPERTSVNMRYHAQLHILRITLLLFAVFMIGCTGTGIASLPQQTPIVSPTNSMAEDNAYFEALRAYRDFLLNKRTLGIGELKHNRVYRYIHYVLPTSEFTIIDMDDDGIPELHVKDKGRGYTIITYDQSELSVWAEFSSDTNLLNNRALYTDHWGKGWFCYYELDKDGGSKYYFYWESFIYWNTDLNEESVRYFIESPDIELENGGFPKEITEEEYNEITAPYIEYVENAANYDMIPWVNYSEWYEEHIDEYVPIEETEALYY